jgi:hypothetical protein
MRLDSSAKLSRQHRRSCRDLSAISEIEYEVSFKAEAEGKDNAMVNKWARIQCCDCFTAADSMCIKRILN